MLPHKDEQVFSKFMLTPKNEQVFSTLRRQAFQRIKIVHAEAELMVYPRKQKNAKVMDQL